jgi:hypothetical protein
LCRQEKAEEGEGQDNGVMEGEGVEESPTTLAEGVDKGGALAESESQDNGAMEGEERKGVEDCPKSMALSEGVDKSKKDCPKSMTLPEGVEKGVKDCPKNMTLPEGVDKGVDKSVLAEERPAGGPSHNKKRAGFLRRVWHFCSRALTVRSTAPL